MPDTTPPASVAAEPTVRETVEWVVQWFDDGARWSDSIRHLSEHVARSYIKRCRPRARIRLIRRTTTVREEVVG